MNEFLNELYGTSQTIGAGGEEDLEKQAAAEFLIKIAEAEGVDLDTLSDEEVGQLLVEVEKAAAEGGIEPEPEGEEEAQEKLAEADFLGRAMAHAYVNELAEIEKQAKSPIPALVRTITETAKKKGARAAAGELGRSQVQALRSAGRAIKSLVTGKAPTKLPKGARGLTVGRRPGESVRRTALRGLGQAAQIAAPTAAGGAALAGGGVAAARALKGKEKKSWDEQFEDAAQERAIEMLAEAGYDVEKVAEAEIEEAVDTRALQMLEEAGYPVEWEQQ
jgi:hypothetical protein